MNDFIEKIKQIQSLEDELDSYIWSIFNRYIKQNKILFSNPKFWIVENNFIQFEGADGCMGCYENISITIPLKFFLDPDKEFDQQKKEKDERERIIQEEKNRVKEQQEKQLFDQLKKKYG